MQMKSLVNAAYDVLSKKFEREGKKSVPLPFKDLLREVGEELNIHEEEELIRIASRFYTDLTLDGRFVIKEDNTWVLREHEKFADVSIDMNAAYSDGAESNIAYNSTIEEGNEEGEEVEASEIDDDKEKELGEEDENENYNYVNDFDDENN